jgi:hypothetical protein
MALPLIYGGRTLGAVTIQSSEERAFGDDDITTLLTMAEHLAVAINNAHLVDELKEAHNEILRNKVFEALTTASTEAIHWIGNKTLPISLTVARLREEIADGKVDVESLKEDLDMISESAGQIIQVKEQLIGAVRELLQLSGKPWVIENVQGAARDMINPVMLCGSAFGLGVRRHRLFETSHPVALIPACAHHTQPEPIDVTGTGGFCKKPRTTPGGGRSRKPKSVQEAREAMGIHWLGRRELSQAIPPAYTRYLAEAMMMQIYLI